MATGNKRMSGLMAVFVSGFLLAVCAISIRDKIIIDPMDWKSLALVSAGAIVCTTFLLAGLKTILFHRNTKE